jgi:glycosyl transferase family 25
MDLSILNECFDKIYVITLENSERENRVSKVLSGVDFEFFYGVNGEFLNVNEFRKNGSNLLRGQLGCALSHIKVYEKIVESNFNKVLVLEDDISISENILQLKFYMDQLPEDWGLFYLGHDGPVVTNTYSNNLCEINRSNPLILHCTHALAIKPWFAKEMIDMNKNVVHTADGLLTQAVIQKDLKTYAAVPKLINPDFIDSIIGDLYKKYGHE